MNDNDQLALIEVVPAQPNTDPDRTVVGPWGPQEPPKRSPLALWDVLWGILVSLLFGLIPSLIAMATYVATTTTTDQALAIEEATKAATSGPAIVASMLMSWTGWLFMAWLATYRKNNGEWRQLFGWGPFRWSFVWISIGLTVLFRALEQGLAFGAERAGMNLDDLGNTDAITAQTGIWLIAIGLFAAVGAPIVEELFFRGFFLGIALRRFSMPVAVALTSIVFGLMHTQASLAGTVFVVGQTALIGVVLAVIRLRYNLVAAIAMHMVFNTSGVVAVVASVLAQ